MAGPPPRLRGVAEAVRAAAADLRLAGRPLLVAVSGGVDSMVLLHVLAELAPGLGMRLAVGHVNHGLRGAGSDGDQAAVEEAARALGLPCAVRHVAPEALRRDRPSRSRPTLQEAARRVRHDALVALAAEAGAERIATAHTLDDQAETVLLRLLRGTGPDGLGGIAPVSSDGRVVRPLLGVSRQAIEACAVERGIAWREDPSNRDPRFARARLREGGLGELAARINPNWLRALSELAEAQRTDAAFTAAEAERAAERLLAAAGDEEAGLWIERKGWDELPDALARRVARIALRRAGAGRDVSRAHLGRFLSFLGNAQPGRSIELPGGLRLVCHGEGFSLRPALGVQLPRRC